MAAKNTAKATVVVTTKPTLTVHFTNVWPNKTTVEVDKKIKTTITATTRDVVKYDESGKPTATVAVTTTLLTRTTPITRTVINKDGKVISQRTTTRTGTFSKTTRVVTPYSSPDYTTEICALPVVSTNPTQAQQVNSAPEIDGTTGQIVSPVDTTGVTYVSVGSSASTENGSVLGQTFRSPRTGIITKMAFSLADVGTAGDLQVLLCGTKDTGEPDTSNTYAKKTVLYADLVKGWLNVTLEPVLVSKGILYSVVLISTGAHTFETAVGGKYSQGTFFYCQDEAWFSGSINEDLGMRVYYADFPQTQVIVSMNPIDLAGGIGGTRFSLYDVVPDACDTTEQVQINGVWTNLTSDEAAYPFTNLPAQVLYRRVLTGTKEVMPMINMGVSRSVAFRARTDFTGVSKAITTGAGVTTTHVTARILGYVEANHDCVATLIKADDSVVAHSAVSDRVTDDPLVIERTWTFTHASLTTFRIKVAGTTNSALDTYGIDEILYYCT